MKTSRFMLIALVAPVILAQVAESRLPIDSLVGSWVIEERSIPGYPDKQQMSLSLTITFTANDQFKFNAPRCSGSWSLEGGTVILHPVKRSRAIERAASGKWDTPTEPAPITLTRIGSAEKGASETYRDSRTLA